MNGYFRIPRSLTRTPLWENADPKVRVIFLTILDHALFMETQFDDHGRMLTLLPGQFCASLEEIARLCGKTITRVHVQRGLKRLKRFGFLKHEVIHVKTVVTITHIDTYDLIFKTADARSDPRMIQEGYNYETQRENEMNEEKKKKNLTKPSRLSRNETGDIAFSFEKKSFENILEMDMQNWGEVYPSVDIRREMLQMVEWCLSNPTKTKSKKLWRKFITGWLSRKNEEIINKQARSPNHQKFEKIGRDTTPSDPSKIFDFSGGV